MAAIQRYPVIHLPNDRRYSLDDSIIFRLRKAGAGWSVSMEKVEVDDLTGRIFMQMDIFTYYDNFAEASRLFSALEKLRDSSLMTVSWPVKNYIVR